MGTVIYDHCEIVAGTGLGRNSPLSEFAKMKYSANGTVFVIPRPIPFLKNYAMRAMSDCRGS